MRMWRGYEFALAEYAEIMCIVWRQRGFKDTLREQFHDIVHRLPYASPPSWLGHDRLHESHRSNLLRKDAAHYGQFGWLESSDLPYAWPINKEVMV